MKRIIALGATAAVLSGCSGAPVERETATTTTSNPAQAAPVRPTEAKNIVLRGNSTGALPRPYRTVEELAAAPEVTMAIRGVVTEALGMYVDHVAVTVLTVRVQGGRDASLVGKTVTVARPGGVVRLRDAVQDALGKQGGPTYSEQELREGWADITFNGMRQSAVGDQVWLFMKANPPGNKTAGIQADYVLVDSVYGLFRRVGTSYVRDAEARQDIDMSAVAVSTLDGLIDRHP